MKKKGRKSEKRRIIDTGIFCIAVLMLFFSIILFVQEYEYVPQEVYVDPPPALPKRTQEPVPSQTIPSYPSYSYSATPYETQTPPPVTETDASYTSTPTQTQQGSRPQATETPYSAPTSEPSDEQGIVPVKLYFIERRISCDILPVGINSNYEMETIRSPYKAGWLRKAPYVLPGEVGKAVIAGHNRWNGHNGTFSVLKKLSVGETVAVEMSDGYATYFRVDELTECAYDDNSIMQPVYDRAMLVLITCKGDWDSVLHTSRTRVVAICSPVE